MALPTAEPDHEAWARDALSRAGLPGARTVELLAGKHADRPVLGATYDDRRVVVKRLAPGRRARVFAGLQELWRSPVGATRSPPGLPEPVAEVPESDAIVVEWIDGAPVGRRGALEQTGGRIPEVARLLADLHGSGVRLASERSAQDIVRTVDSAVRERAPATLQPELLAIVQQLRELAAGSVELTAVHGDFTPRNVFGAPEGPRLIDLDVLRQADPALDLGHWSAWCFLTESVAGRPSWDLGAELLDHYRRHRPSPDLDRRVRFHEAAQLLKIGLGSSFIGRRPELGDEVVAAAKARLRA